MKHRASYSMRDQMDGAQFLNKGQNSVNSFCTVPKVLGVAEGQYTPSTLIFGR